MSNVTTALKRAVETEFEGNQSSFSARVGIKRSTFSLDLNEARKISDERFGLYLRAVNRANREMLLRARLLDLIPEELHEELIFQTGTSVREDLPRFSPNPALTDEQRSALEWLANELTRDSQLIEPVMTICERLGWTRPDKKSQY